MRRTGLHWIIIIYIVFRRIRTLSAPVIVTQKLEDVSHQISNIRTWGSQLETWDLRPAGGACRCRPSRRYCQQAPCGGLWALSIKKHQIYGIMSMHSPKLILTLDVVSSEHIGCHARRIFNHVLEMPVRSLPSLARARASTSSSRSGVIIALIASHKTWTCASSRVHASTCKIDPLHFRLLVTCCDIHVKRAALWRQPAIR